MNTKFPMLAALLFVSLCGSITFSQEREKSAAIKFENAVALKRVNPRYPTVEQSLRREGWVVISYTVDVNGSVRDAIVVDSSGNHAMDAAAVRAALRWTYKPAMLDGVPVEQAFRQVKIIFAFKSMGVGARPQFVSSYKRIGKLIDQGSLDEAAREIGEFQQSAVQNLYEDAWFWVLKYRYCAARQDQEGMLSSALKAVAYEGMFLPDKMYLLSLGNLFAAQTSNHKYADALITWERIVATKGSEQVAAQLASAVAQIKELAASDKTIAVSGVVGENRLWEHRLLRHEFEFDQVTGTVSKLDILCDRELRTSVFVANQNWKIPESWVGCSLHVYGDAGTTFRLLEFAATPTPAA